MTTYYVNSFTTDKVYAVEVERGAAVSCTCPHFVHRKPARCKHFAAAETLHERSATTYRKARELARGRGVHPREFAVMFERIKRGNGLRAAFKAVANIATAEGAEFDRALDTFIRAAAETLRQRVSRQ